MKYSSALLKKFISVNDTPENIAQNLILKTCEIEEIVQRQIPDLVVIGYVTEVTKHPDADKLFVCQIDCGSKGKYQILTGGENIIQDTFVPIALPGCYLPVIDLKIEPRKMRGLDSAGMICSKQELGIIEDTDKHRIWTLQSGGKLPLVPQDKKVESGELNDTNNYQPSTINHQLFFDFDDLTQKDLGVGLGEKYPWLNSYVFDVDNKGVTHRPDLTGHFGVTTEINAIYDKKDITFNKISDYYKIFANTDIFETLSKSNKIDRNILVQTEKLRSYVLIQIDGIQTKISSFLTRLELIDLGQQTRNNRVDFSNLFMVITGQPVHFFDADKVNGDIIVRNAKQDEEFMDLFDKIHLLTPNDMVIADKDKILALAGVIGGKNSGVSDSTKNILVEIANFDPVSVRKTGTRIGVRTDAELRYEKNINPVYTLYCLLLFLDQLEYYKKDLGNFNIKGLCSFASQETKNMKNSPVRIDLNFKEMSEYIFGKQVRNFEKSAINYLEGLGFQVNKSQGIHETLVPIRRSPNDINIPEDVCEEVVRLYGYENVERVSLTADIQNVPFGDECQIQRTMEDIFVKEGKFNQMETYPWVETKLLEIFSVDKSDLYSLINPVDVDAPYLRNNLLYNLVSYTIKNSKFFDDIKIFDIGKVWEKKSEGTNKDSFENIENPEKYASYTTGEKYQLGAIVYKKSTDNRQKDTLLEAKSLLDYAFKTLGIKKDISLQITNFNNYHPKKQSNILLRNGEMEEGRNEGISLSVKSGENPGESVVGFIGSIHPLLLKNLKLPENGSLTYLSLYLDEIIKYSKKNQAKVYSFETLQDQIVYRDLCFVLDGNKNFGEIISIVKNIPEVKDVQIFDIYEGENLSAGKKSISLTIKITGDGQLTTEQINEVMNKTICEVQKCGGELRS